MIDYELIFKKDLWEDGEFIELVLAGRRSETEEPYDNKNLKQVHLQSLEQDKLLTLINLSIDAKTLRPHSSYYVQNPKYLKELYRNLPKDRQYKINRFYPKDLLVWGRLKEILPDKLNQWHDQPINQPVSDTPAQNEEKPLTETERASLLKIILGMAMDSYKYDPDAEKNAATGSNAESIRSALQKYGLDADNKTISKYLTEAANRNPTARPHKP